jgi:hypothetical protein
MCPMSMETPLFDPHFPKRDNVGRQWGERLEEVYTICNIKSLAGTTDTNLETPLDSRQIFLS